MEENYSAKRWNEKITKYVTVFADSNSNNNNNTKSWLLLWGGFDLTSVYFNRNSLRLVFITKHYSLFIKYLEYITLENVHIMCVYKRLHILNVL